MKLVFFGGVAGVGKSTLLSWLETVYTGQVVFIDPGELFRRFLYHNSVKTADEVEEMILGKVEEVADDAVVVMHWHYAVRRPDGYIPQVNFSRLKRMVKSKNTEGVVLLLVEAPIEVILERRLADSGSKTRAVSEPIVCEEVAMDEKFLNKEYALLCDVLGESNVEVFRLTNVDLSATRGVLGELFGRLLD